jgi:hypothetical protein
VRDKSEKREKGDVVVSSEVTAGRNKRSRPLSYAPRAPRAATLEALAQISAVPRRAELMKQLDEGNA